MQPKGARVFSSAVNSDIRRERGVVESNDIADEAVWEYPECDINYLSEGLATEHNLVVTHLFGLV